MMNQAVIQLLIGDYFSRYPGEAARQLEEFKPSEIADYLENQTPLVAARVLARINPPLAMNVIGLISPEKLTPSLDAMDLNQLASIMACAKKARKRSIHASSLQGKTKGDS